MAVSGRDGGSPPGEFGELAGGGFGAPCGGGLEVVRGGRMMKQVGPAFRWLACGEVGLRVVFV